MKRVLLVVAIVAVAVLGFVGFAAPDEMMSPTDVVKTFIRGAYDNDRAKLEQTFDYDYAMNEINRVLFGSKRTGKPYELWDIQDTLITYFTMPSGHKKSGEFIGPDVKFDERINKDRGIASVLITKPEVRPGDFFKKETRIGLVMVDGQWKIRYFPEFFPFDYWEVTTNIPSKSTTVR